MSSINEIYELFKKETKLPLCLCKIISEYNTLDKINNEKIYLHIKSQKQSKYNNDKYLTYNQFKFPYKVKNYDDIINEKYIDTCKRILLFKRLEIYNLIDFIYEIKYDKIIIKEKKKTFKKALIKFLKLLKKSYVLLNDFCNNTYNLELLDDLDDVSNNINRYIKYFNKMKDNFIFHIFKFSFKKTISETKKIEYKFFEDLFVTFSRKNVLYVDTYKTAKNIALFYGMENDEINLLYYEDIYYN